MNISTNRRGLERFHFWMESMKTLATETLAFCEEVLPRIQVDGKAGLLTSGSIVLGRCEGTNTEVFIQADVTGTWDLETIDSSSVGLPEGVQVLSITPQEARGSSDYLCTMDLKWREHQYTLILRKSN